jgi:hypothetical protein
MMYAATRRRSCSVFRPARETMATPKLLDFSNEQLSKVHQIAPRLPQRLPAAEGEGGGGEGPRLPTSHFLFPIFPGVVTLGAAA